MANRRKAPGQPVTAHQWSEAQVNERGLRAAIGRLYDSNPHSRLGVGGSWASAKTLFEEPETIPLREWIEGLLPEPPKYLDGWGLIMKPGTSLAPHDHIKSHRGRTNDWAGVYYLTAGDALHHEHGTTEVAPGACLVFPATLVHWVPSVSEYRMAIAWNATSHSAANPQGTFHQA